LAPVFPMELTDDIENGALLVDADGAGSPDALAHGPHPAGRQFAEPGTTGIVPVQPQNRGAGHLEVCDPPRWPGACRAT